MKNLIISIILIFIFSTTVLSLDFNSDPIVFNKIKNTIWKIDSPCGTLNQFIIEFKDVETKEDSFAFVSSYSFCGKINVLYADFQTDYNVLTQTNAFTFAYNLTDYNILIYVFEIVDNKINGICYVTDPELIEYPVYRISGEKIEQECPKCPECIECPECSECIECLACPECKDDDSSFCFISNL